MSSGRPRAPRAAALLLLLALAGCDGADAAAGDDAPPETSDTIDTGDAAAATPEVCAAASERLGALACLHVVDGPEAFEALSLPEPAGHTAARTSKYFAPATPAAPLPALVMNVSLHDWHYEFMRAVFPDLYAGLTLREYDTLLLDPDRRVYYGGSVVLLREPCRGHRYAFNVYEDRLRYGPTPPTAVRAVRDVVADLLAGERPLFVPGAAGPDAAPIDWAGAGIDVFDCGAARVEVYTTGVAYGTVRHFTPAGFARATEEGGYGWQDIVVLDETPFDIEAVTAAVVTGTPQNALSHVNIRAAQRGTPNLYVPDAAAAFAPWEGRLVRLAVTADGYEVTPDVPLEEALAAWEAARPATPAIPPADWEDGGLPALTEVPVATAAERAAAFARFGGKGANLAVLRAVAGAPLAVDGFLVPLHWYRRFMETNRIPLRDAADPESVSLADYVRHWLADPSFRGDPAVRRATLERLVATMEDVAAVDPDLEARLVARTSEVFGSDRVMLRYRSSSNVEDAIGFSGAGLYESRSVCAADTSEGRTAGSACDPGRDDPRPIAHGLRDVWASFWTPRAVEERLWFGLADPDAVGMAVAATPAFLDEQAQGVAFTGVPQCGGGDRMLVNAQVGETSVVRPPPGVLSESVLLSLEGDDVLVERRQSSSLVTPGAVVLTDAEYDRLARALADIRARFPVDGARPDQDVVLDLEFKLDRERALRLKQARPFVRCGGP